MNTDKIHVNIYMERGIDALFEKVAEIENRKKAAELKVILLYYIENHPEIAAKLESWEQEHESEWRQ